MEISEIRRNDLLWYTTVCFDRSYRTNGRQEPVEVCVKEIEENSFAPIFIQFPDGRIDWVSGIHLFQTEEDAWQDWNSKFYNQLDRLESFYQGKKKYLENKIKE